VWWPASRSRRPPFATPTIIDVGSAIRRLIAVRFLSVGPALSRRALSGPFVALAGRSLSHRVASLLAIDPFDGGLSQPGSPRRVWSATASPQSIDQLYITRIEAYLNRNQVICHDHIPTKSNIDVIKVCTRNRRSASEFAESFFDTH
jgi:hypothetical protein